MKTGYYQPIGTVGVLQREMLLKTAEVKFGDKLRNGSLLGKLKIIKNKRYVLTFINCSFLRKNPTVTFSFEEESLWKMRHTITGLDRFHQKGLHHPNCKSIINLER